ncbi:MAG TPA: hypothetical protein VLI43_11650 [Gemmatimonadaceae bacterium]|nr:hypothetical protein [Gemmatimonadaceae bacterium]
MRSPARLKLVVSLLALSVAAACGSDSTGPKAPTAAQLAAHFDSIAIQAQTQSATNGAYSGRGFLVTLIEIPAALGAVPASVSVTTATGVESWKAYELLAVPPTNSADSVFFLLMFRDADAHTAMLINFDSTGTGDLGIIITSDTIMVGSSSASATTSLSSVSTTCATPSASLLNPQLATQTQSIGTCNLARFTTSVHLTSPATTGMDAALTSVSFSNSSVNGARVVDQASGAAVRRVLDMLKTARANRHH